MKGLIAWYRLQPKWVKTIGVSALLLLLPVVLSVALLAYQLSPRSMCGSQGNYAVTSPDGAHRAVLYEFDCGATTDFGTHLAVEKNKGEFDPFDADAESMVFSANSNHGRAFTGGDSILNVDLHWVDSSHLVVYVPSEAKVFTERDKMGPISIAYKTD